MTPTFDIQSPMCAENRLASLLNPPSMKHVLLIEDDRNLVAGLLRNFRRSPFETTVECRGDTGLRRALDMEPDAVVLDLGLPGMRGAKILEELQRHLPSIPVIVITGDQRWAHLARQWNNVAASFSKPFDTARLVSALEP